jgi:anti-sigma factor RsiW
MSGDDDDSQLVAFIDGRLDERARSAIESRLANEADLRERLARLQDGGRPFASAFQALLDAAPIERLKASLSALDEDERAGTPLRRRSAFRASRLGVAAAVLLFCVGIFVGRYAPLWPAQEEWRDAVAEYMSLYTPDTFASDAASQGNELAALSRKIGLVLTPEGVALSGLQFKAAQIFAYNNAPLGQLGYIDPATGPVLFCIIRDSEPDAAIKAENRDGFAVASWARGGRGYMLIGRLPVAQIAGLADTLERRF